VLLIVGLVAVGFVWWALVQPVALFVVTVRAGRAVTTRGNATAAFVAAVGDVCREFGISSGAVRGIPTGPRVALRFTAHFPPAAQQRLRNWWAASGWAPPSAAR
jgi:hypothetical protein